MVKKGLLLSLAAVLSGCAGGEDRAFPLFHEPDQARSFLACDDADSLTDGADYYRAMSRCLRQGESRRAVLGFAVAGVSTWKTAYQEGTDSARAAHRRLFPAARQQLSPAESLMLDRRLERMAADDSQWRNLCHAVRLLEPEENDPIMFADGMRSLWEEGVRQYLHCRPVEGG